MNSAKRVFVYGAYGHTGRLVVDELRSRDYRLVLSGRNMRHLAEVAQKGDVIKEVAIEDTDVVQRALEGTTALLNCAGPFGSTSAPLIDAAIRAGIPYLGMAAEPDVILDAVWRYDTRANLAGVAVLPSTGFFGGLGSVLVDIARGDWSAADHVSLAIALDRWVPTQGSRAAALRVAGHRWMHRNGAPTDRFDTPSFGVYAFPPPYGTQHVLLEYPAPEVILVPRKLPVDQMEVVMAAQGLREFRASTEPPSILPRGGDNSAQTFVVEAQVTQRGVIRRASLHGHDIYGISAPLMVDGLDSVLARPVHGVLSLAEVIDPEIFLKEHAGYMSAARC